MKYFKIAGSLVTVGSNYFIIVLTINCKINIAPISKKSEGIKYAFNINSVFISRKFSFYYNKYNDATNKFFLVK